MTAASVYTIAMRRWVSDQTRCPGCGGGLEGGPCQRNGSSIWCGIKNLHHVPRDVVIPPGKCCPAHHAEGCTDGGPGCCPDCPINPTPAPEADR